MRTSPAPAPAALLAALLLGACGDDGATTTATTTDTASSTGATSSTDASTSAGPTSSDASTSASSSSNPSSSSSASETSTTTTPPTSTSVGTSTTGDATDGATDTEVTGECVVHVNGDDGNDNAGGGSWLFAKRTVNAGLDVAEALTSDGEGPCEVWVAAGTYTPPGSNASIALRTDVALYGGFAGDESSRDERDWDTNLTVLSGDLGVPNEIGDNARHVVTGADGARVDGFTITGGYARGSAIERNGGGVTSSEGHVTIANCVITGNTSGRGADDEGGAIGGNGGYGAGIYIAAGASLTLLDSVVSDNLSGDGGSGSAIGGAGGEGAGLMFYGASLTVRGVVFEDNVAGAGGQGGDVGGTGGGGVGLALLTTGTARIEHSVFRHNIAGAGGPAGNVGGSGSGGALLATGQGDVIINDCLFQENLVGAGGTGGNLEGPGGGNGGLLYSGYTSPGGLILANSRFEDHDAYRAALAILSEPMEPSAPVVIVNTVVVNNSSPGSSGGLYIRSNGQRAVTVANCSIGGNTANNQGAGVHYGASEAAGDEPVRLVNSILWGNTANSNAQLFATELGINLANPVQLQVERSAIEGGCTPNTALLCGAVLTDDPLFADLAGGDLHLGPASLLVDAGDDALLPADLADLDDDGDVDESTPLDRDALPRVVGASVDLGAFEVQ